MDPILLTAVTLYFANVISVGTLFLIYNLLHLFREDDCGQDAHTATVGTQTSPDYYAARLQPSEDASDAMPHDPASCEWCDKAHGSEPYVSHDLKASSFSITQTYDVSPTGNKEYAEKSKVGQSAIKPAGRLVELVFYCKACGATDHICSPAAGLFCPNLKTY